jgi:predicted ATPase
MIVVVADSRSIPKTSAKFALRRDRWDDYGYKTQYQLFLINHDAEHELIGSVKILKKGQREASSPLLDVGHLPPLPEGFCSVGQSFDYYERLAALAPDLRDGLLIALRDIVKQPEIRAEFRSEPGWDTSLFRDFKETDEFLELARVLLERDYSALPAADLTFAFKPAGWTDPIHFQFQPIEPEPATSWGMPSRRPSGDRLPSRLIALIGRNGSGKSTLLARLARVAVADRRARVTEAYSAIGALDPEGLGFTRVLAISYSAFDSFEIPGVTQEERAQVIRELEKGSGRYFFCGLRDIAKETDVALGDAQQPQDRRDDAKLRPLGEIADEFARLIEQIRARGADDEFAKAAEPLLRDPSFNDLKQRTLDELLGDNARSAFLGWSTGHKIVMHVIASLAAHIQPRSLVLFDEPETHLHPPLLAALMHALRYLLNARSAFAIVATHSPVVVQETPSAFVLVVRREGAASSAQPPEIETFGENTGTITYSVFGLSAETTDFHAHLDRLVETFKALEPIEALFPSGLSHQARAYVMTRLAAEGRAS